MAMDWDAFFSYQTVKYVTIKERKLGIIHYILQFVIFIYIVLYTIIYQQRYLLMEPPYGTIRATVLEPSPYKDISALPYCLQTQATYKSYTNYPCTYLRGTDLTFPPGQINSIFVATRVKDQYYNYSDCQLPTNNYPNPVNTLASCPPPTRYFANPRYFLADIEDYTVYMEHAIFGRMNELLVSNADCDGKMEFRNGSSKLEIKFTERNRTGDIVSLQTILNAADVSSLDEPSGLGHTYRYDGALIVTVVEYENYVSDPKQFYYSYKFYLMPKQDVVNMQPTQMQGDIGIQRNWNGVRIIFMVVGQIGAFDFPTLLTSLVNGMVLIKVATVIVDLLVLHIMPSKKLYQRGKYDIITRDSDYPEDPEAMKLTRPVSMSAGENTKKQPLLSDFS